MAGNHPPLGIGQVTGIASGLPSSAARTLGTRGSRVFLVVTTRDHGARAWHLSRTTHRNPDNHRQGHPTQTPINQTLTKGRRLAGKREHRRWPDARA